MIMMMTDPDRVALSAFLPSFLFCFIRPITPIHANVNVHPLPPECPPCNLSHILLPLVFGFTSQQQLLFSPRQHFGHARPSIASHAFCAAPLSRSSSISTSFAPKQPRTTQKKTCNQSHVPPSSPHSLQASTRTRTCVRLSMYLLPVAVFISHQKEGFDREETGAQKNAVRSEQYFIVVPIQETIIKSIKFLWIKVSQYF